jgi:hypothetical protein
MTREIKFRAWNRDAKTMDYDPGVDVDWSRVPVNALLANEVSTGLGYVTNYVFMQYTGLKDKNVVEIYEGDIVVAPGGRRWSIVYLGDRFVLEDNLPGDPVHVPYSLVDCEVIGNIYQNPELLPATQPSSDG